MNGTARSRAYLMAASAPSRLRYGLPGAAHRPWYAASIAAPDDATASVGTHAASIDAPRERAASAIASSVARCDGSAGS